MSDFSTRLTSFSDVLNRVANSLPEGVDPPKMFREYEFLLETAKDTDSKQLKRLVQLSEEEIDWKYRTIISLLNFDFKVQESRTRPEFHFEGVIKSISKFEVYKSYWLGGSCVDFYFPNYSVVVEIDGGIHDQIGKMLKDVHKDEWLKARKIQVWRYPNENTLKSGYNTVQALKSGQVRRLDVRAKNRCLKLNKIQTILKLRHQIMKPKKRRAFGTELKN